LIRIDDFHENSRIAGDSRIAVPHPIGDCLLGDQVTAERLVGMEEKIKRETNMNYGAEGLAENITDIDHSMTSQSPA
jgi:hypothetical protein